MARRKIIGLHVQTLTPVGLQFVPRVAVHWYFSHPCPRDCLPGCVPSIGSSGHSLGPPAFCFSVIAPKGFILARPPNFVSRRLNIFLSVELFQTFFYCLVFLKLQKVLSKLLTLFQGTYPKFPQEAAELHELTVAVYSVSVSDQPRQHIKKQRHYFANKGLSSQGYGFSSSHVWM